MWVLLPKWCGGEGANNGGRAGGPVRLPAEQRWVALELAHGLLNQRLGGPTSAAIAIPTEISRDELIRIQSNELFELIGESTYLVVNRRVRVPVQNPIQLVQPKYMASKRVNLAKFD